MAKRNDAVMTIDELAKYMKLSKSTLYHFARDGKIPGVKIGRHWRFNKNAIDEWMRKGGRFTIGPRSRIAETRQ